MRSVMPDLFVKAPAPASSASDLALHDDACAAPGDVM
jgi:hypothetical protein